MKFIVFVHPGDKKGYEAGKMPDPKLLETMGKYNEELVNAGVMLAGEGLHPSTKAVRLRFPGGAMTKGPFADSLIGGFWIWNVKSEEEAIAWAKRAPMENGATLELRKAFEPEDFGPEVAKQERELEKKLQKQLKK